MKINGTNGYNLDVSTQESQDILLLSIVDGGGDNHPANVEIDEHAVNLLIKDLQSKAEDMKRHREFLEAERMGHDGRLH